MRLFSLFSETFFCTNFCGVTNHPNDSESLLANADLLPPRKNADNVRKSSHLHERFFWKKKHTQKKTTKKQRINGLTTLDWDLI